MSKKTRNSRKLSQIEKERLAEINHGRTGNFVQLKIKRKKFIKQSLKQEAISEKERTQREIRFLRKNSRKTA